jgi:NADH dehydrogenase
LIGILFENKKNSFKNIHTIFPGLLAKLCKEYDVKNFIHISALGINDAIDSEYAKSKLEGEKNILSYFSNAIILRPSIVYSIDDNFTTNFMTLLSRLPFFPLYYSGKTKFMPIHCSDLIDIIYHVMTKQVNSQIIECVGPETISLEEILKKLVKLIDKKRFLIPMPIFLANLSAIFFQLLPKPLLTQDQLRLLKYDNVLSSKYKSNFDIGIPSRRIFDEEVKKYCYMWKEGGEFNTSKYNS